MNEKKPNFDRNGKVTSSFLGWLFGPKTLVIVIRKYFHCAIKYIWLPLRAGIQPSSWY